jgi:two-component system phosphate regulon sensor histidine kinase PhoR
MKTPLAIQRSAIEIVLSRERTRDEYRQALEEALQENNHLSSTLKNILDLAWSETPDEQKNTIKINLTELVEELCDISVKMGLQKNLEVKKSVQNDIYIFGFKDKLARAILNIIDNAIKYTPSNGKLFIELSKIHTKAVLNIIDNGHGIKEQDMPRIFDRFYRGSATDKIFGSGLGLAITKSIISLHKGFIKVDSKVGKGTTFTINLPIDKA